MLVFFWIISVFFQTLSKIDGPAYVSKVPSYHVKTKIFLKAQCSNFLAYKISAQRETINLIENSISKGNALETRIIPTCSFHIHQKKEAQKYRKNWLNSIKTSVHANYSFHSALCVISNIHPWAQLFLNPAHYLPANKYQRPSRAPVILMSSCPTQRTRVRSVAPAMN